MEDITTQSVVFDDLFGKTFQASFDQPNCSSDGSAILLKACDKNLGLIDAISMCLRDDRQQGKVTHTIRDLVHQHVLGIVHGYEGCNDSARLATDPEQRLLMDRDPATGQLLASQPA